MVKMPWSKRPWEKVDCIFVLQEIGPGLGKGWQDILDPVGEPLSKQEVAEHFRPGRSYRLMAKSSDEGKLVGMVWKYFEPFPPGQLKRKEEKEKPSREPAPPPSPAEFMDAYAEEVVAVLAPMAKLVKVFSAIRDSFSLGGSQQSQSSGNVSNPYPPLPALEFDGKAPWFMHPYVAKYFGDTIKDVVDHTAKRFGFGEEEEAKGEEKGEEPSLPRISAYRKPVTETRPVLTTARGRRRITTLPPTEETEEPSPLENQEEDAEDE